MVRLHQYHSNILAACFARLQIGIQERVRVNARVQGSIRYGRGIKTIPKVTFGVMCAGVTVPQSQAYFLARVEFLERSQALLPAEL